jgi:hypothetical protein
MVLGLSAVAPRSVAAETSRGGVFLPLGHGARAQGLGGAGIALQRDDAAVYWNPANLAWMSMSNGVTLMHTEILPGVDNGYDTVSYGRPQGRRLGRDAQAMRPALFGWGAFYSHLGLGFDSGDWAENRLQVAGSWAFCNYASFGLATKLLWLSNEFEAGNASGVGFDVGVSVLVKDSWFASVVWRDVYTRVWFDTETAQTQSPELDFGLDWEPHRGWSAEVDAIVRESNLQSVLGGLEWRTFGDLVALRAGFSAVQFSIRETRVYPTAGAGLRWSHLGLDYGVSFDSDDAFGLGHRFALRVAF